MKRLVIKAISFQLPVSLLKSRALINIGKMAPRKIIPILDKTPMPNQMITSGKKGHTRRCIHGITNGSKT